MILATRRSALALQQSGWVKTELERCCPGLRVELSPLTTTGDRMPDRPLPQIGGKGLFTKELEEALLGGRAHFAVHSLKDLPTELSPGLVLAAVPVREDPRDALISRDGKPFAQLPHGVRIGTSSVRRAAQLLRLRPDARVVPLRGNLDTRLRKLRAGSFDALVVAAAGLRRMGWQDQITEYFPESVLYPAIGQGALGIEARAEDHTTLEALAALEDPWSRIATAAERALLRHLGGGCQIPIAAYTRRDGNRLVLSAVVLRPDGAEMLQAEDAAACCSVEAAEQIGRKTAEALIRQGAGRLLGTKGP